MRYLLKRESTTSTDASGYGAGLCSCHASCSPAKSRGSNASADAALPAAPMNVRLFMPILRRSRKPSFPPLKKVRPSRVESILASVDGANGPRDQPVVAVLQLFEARIFLYSGYQAFLNCASAHPVSAIEPRFYQPKTRCAVSTIQNCLIPRIQENSRFK